MECYNIVALLKTTLGVLRFANHVVIRHNGNWDSMMVAHVDPCNKHNLLSECKRIQYKSEIQNE
jgi:hypothetical protein